MDQPLSDKREPYPASRHSDRYAQISDLLRQPRMRLGFPGELENEFRDAHGRESAALFRANVLYVLLLYLALGMGIMAIVPLSQLGHWPFGYLGLGVIIVTALVLARQGVLDRNYDRQVSGIAFAGMMLVIALPAMVNDPLMVQVAMVGIIYAVVVIGAVLGLRFVPACVAMWGGGLSGLMVLALLGNQLDWLLLHQTFTGGCLIGSFLAWMAEKRSRLVFLQKSLLALEKQRSDRLAEEMKQMSRKDGLTGLANRRYFDEALGREWLRCQRDGSALSLMFIDVDYFKPYNDHYGHQAGDECLQKIAGVLGSHTRRPGDIAARYGGEEFVVVYPQTGPEALDILARQILRSVRELEEPHATSSVAPVVTVSIGLATLVPEASSQPEDLISAADHAVYMAKRKGRNRAEKAE